MQLSQALPKLKARWMINWKKHNLPLRTFDLTMLFFIRIGVTIFFFLLMGSFILYLLPDFIKIVSLQFLALVYVLYMLIVTARSFDQDSIRFMLKQVSADMAHVVQNTGATNIESLRQDIAHLEDRLGPP
jgi:hypothetical protein